MNGDGNVRGLDGKAAIVAGGASDAQPDDPA